MGTYKIYRYELMTFVELSIGKTGGPNEYKNRFIIVPDQGLLDTKQLFRLA
jgi:hypothetical protein